MARGKVKRVGGSRGGAGFGRALSLLAFLPIASRVPMYTRLISSLVMDERMPMQRKALLAGAAGYLVLGRDLIPDDWMHDNSPFNTTAENRQAYVDYLTRRLEAPRHFVEEAIRAR